MRAALAALLVTVAVSAAGALASEDDAPAVEDVWVCPLHPETHHDGPGPCEVCQRPREERTVSYRWACPMHPDLAGSTPGACAACGMDRTATTAEAVWRCPSHPDVLRTRPGSCPHDGAPLPRTWRTMAHGDHNPRHGGLFFMAADRFHHLEGTYRDGRFRLYLYDNYTEPIPTEGIRARIGDRVLESGPGGAALEAPLPPPHGLPVEVVLHVDFGSGVEDRFDFVFSEASLPPELPPLVIPEAPGEIASAIAVRDERLRELIQRGAWTRLYVPALQAKDLAIALSEADPSTPERAVNRLVRGAWLLDVHGDLGDRRRVEDAYQLFVEGLSELSIESGDAR